MSGNTFSHNRKRNFLVCQMQPYVGKTGFGLAISEQDFDFDGNVHGPDLAFISSSKLHLIDWDRRVQRFVPDLTIEIISGNDRFKDVIKKATRYRRCGTREVWVLDLANRHALVFADDRQAILGDDAVFESNLIPGFSIRLGELFDWT